MLSIGTPVNGDPLDVHSQDLLVSHQCSERKKCLIKTIHSI